MSETEQVVAVAVATVWTGPDAPRADDAAAVADRPDIGAWTAGLGDARGQLHGRTLTQALLGEPVVVTAEHGDWLEVRLPWQPRRPGEDGYPGWVRRAHVTTGALATSADRVGVALPHAECRPEDGSQPAVDLSYGTLLDVVRRDDREVVVNLPDHTQGRLPAGAVRRVPTRPDRAALPGTARVLLGLRYVWGGTSGWGPDCSGLVHLTHRLHGITVPRDAADQARALAELAESEAGPGDVLLFARDGRPAHHVGLVTSEPGTDLRMLHAPEGRPGEGGHVEDTPVAEERRTHLWAAGTLLAPTAHR